MNSLRQRIDRYTLLILLLVGGILGTAGALTFRAQYNQHDLQCEVAVTWLEESAATSRRFTSTPRMPRVDAWIVEQEGLNSPNAAKPLIWAILDSARFHRDYRENARPSTAGILYSPEYENRIDRAAQSLIDHCPETEALLEEAFPMVFVKDDQ